MHRCVMHRCVLALVVSAAHAFVATTTNRPCSLALRSSILSDDVFPSTATDVFVGNMPYGMSDDYVKDLVYTVRKDDGSPVNPEVLRVTVPRDEETGKDRGLAFVKVLDATQAADLSAALDGFEYRAVWKSTSVSGALLGDDVAALARSSGEEPASPRHRAGGASMAWRTTR